MVNSKGRTIKCALAAERTAAKSRSARKLAYFCKNDEFQVARRLVKLNVIGRGGYHPPVNGYIKFVL